MLHSPHQDDSALRRATAGVLVILTLIVIAYFAYHLWATNGKYSLVNTVNIRSGVDGLNYRVHLAHANQAAASDMLAALNSRVIALMRHLRGKYLHAEGFPERADATRRLLSRYNPENLTENSPRDPIGDTSYTLDKGRTVALCLREKDPAATGDPDVHDFHDMETLTFVTFHELTHIAITEVDHPPRFWRAFKFILEEGREAGLIEGRDYEKNPIVYCGILVDYNPLYDPSLSPIV